MDSEKIICIYHANCADGFGAAWAVWKRFPDAEFYPAKYGETPPDVTNKRVILVDFCYAPEVLRDLSKKAASILVLDHHKSAYNAIKNFESDHDRGHLFVHMPEVYMNNLTWERHLHNVNQDYCQNSGTVIYTLFDMERSGAMIAYNFFHPDKTPPKAIYHIQDRDLWKFELEGTREFQAALFSYPYDFTTWDHIINSDPNILIQDGKAIERKHHKDIQELLSNKRLMTIGGYNVHVVNLPYTMASDACHIMCKESKPFAACYYDSGKERCFSLRSIGDFDVSEIAKLYGGGGHKNAAGFRLPLGWEGETPVDIANQ